MYAGTLSPVKFLEPCYSMAENVCRTQNFRFARDTCSVIHTHTRTGVIFASTAKRIVGRCFRRNSTEALDDLEGSPAEVLKCPSWATEWEGSVTF